MLYFTSNGFFIKGKPQEILYHLEYLKNDYLFVSEMLMNKIH